MAGENLPNGPENSVNGGKTTMDSITSKKNSEIAAIFQDIHKMKYNAVKLDVIPGSTFDEAVDMLLKSKTEGKNCYIEFNRVKIYTADTQDKNDAYIQYYGMTKDEREEKARQLHEEQEIAKIKRKEREKGYEKKIADSREGLTEVKITKENVVAGLKFIAEHPKMEQNQLIDELIKLGCNFTFDDIEKQYPKEVKLFPGMKRGHLGCGASVIANVMVSEYGRSYCDDRFLSVDDETSVYAFIRKVTHNRKYTKEYVDSLAQKGESKEGLEEGKITKENVVAGLKFIAEHPKMEQNQLIDELIKLGCNFTFDDIKKQFPEEVKLFPGMKEGDLGCGASVIANVMVSEFGRSYCDDRFLSVDDETSVYAFIRKVSGDERYTKAYVDSLIKRR